MPTALGCPWGQGWKEKGRWAGDWNALRKQSCVFILEVFETGLAYCVLKKKKRVCFLQQDLAVDHILEHCLGAWCQAEPIALSSLFGLGFLCSTQLVEEMPDTVLFTEFRRLPLSSEVL